MKMEEWNDNKRKINKLEKVAWTLSGRVWSKD
jgi:hypothetical protein